MYKNLLFFLALGAVFLGSCGDEEPAPDLANAIIGSWNQVLFTTDCLNDSLNTSREFVCDDMNCQTFIFGDSTVTSRNITNGNVSMISEFYRITGDQIEFCNSLEFDGICDPALTISISNNRLTIRGPRDPEDDCAPVREFAQATGMGGS